MTNYFKGAASFKEAMRMGAEIYHTLKGVIKEKYGIDGMLFSYFLQTLSRIWFMHH